MVGPNTDRFLSEFEERDDLDPRYAERLKEELADHIDDSIEDAQIGGTPQNHAEEEALARIGDVSSITKNLQQALSYHPLLLYAETVLLGVIVGLAFLAVYYLTLLGAAPSNLARIVLGFFAAFCIYLLVHYRIQQFGISDRVRHIVFSILHAVTGIHAVGLCVVAIREYRLFSLLSVLMISAGLVILWMLAHRLLLIVEQWYIAQPTHPIMHALQRTYRPLMLLIIVFALIDIGLRMALSYRFIEELPWFAHFLQLRFLVGVDPTILAGILTRLNPLTASLLAFTSAIFSVLSIIASLAYYIVRQRWNPLVRFPWIKIMLAFSILYSMLFRQWPIPNFDWQIPQESITVVRSESYRGWAVELLNYWQHGLPPATNVDATSLECRRFFANGVDEQGYCSTLVYRDTVLLHQDQPRFRITNVVEDEQTLTIEFHKRYARDNIVYSIDKFALHD